MKIQECPTYWINIWIAGDYEQAKQTCREYCFKHGLCITVTKTNYIYSAGEECGVIIGIRNYPRFPKTFNDLYITAMSIGEILREKLCQDSFMIEEPGRTNWLSWRDERESNGK